MGDNKPYTAELTQLEIVALVSYGRRMAKNERVSLDRSMRDVITSALGKLAAIDCGHGYTVMDSCPMCDAEDDD